MSSGDTIFALATSAGKSGVAIIRLSGSGALLAFTALTRRQSIAPRYATFVSFRQPGTEQLIDTGLALYFKAPHSFTGEDVLEFHTHGSRVVIREMLEVLARMDGFRMAEPGEFTRRAFMHQKMDLTEAEGLADLIEAETDQQKAQALHQMQGYLSGFYQNLRERVIRILAHLEAYIDFPDEDIPFSVLQGLTEESAALARDIHHVLQDEKRGERLREGIVIAILGAPNVGKSSLLNRLAQREAAIVSTVAGTTRDVIEVHMDIAGYAVTLMDTAGIRESGDVVEIEGIRRAKEKAATADIKLIVVDGTSSISVDILALADDKSMIVRSKMDIDSSVLTLPMPYLNFSTYTGEGIELLMEQLAARIEEVFSSKEAPLITRSRHRLLLEQALQAIEKSMKIDSLELKCEELRQAGLVVGKITGKIQVDDVLDIVFGSFCIGK